MKCLSYSNRFYYKELSEEDANCIKKDLILYNAMLHTAYKKLYITCFYGVKEAVSLEFMRQFSYCSNICMIEHAFIKDKWCIYLIKNDENFTKHNH
ncbi:hypothetical protein K110096F8_25730 [Dielma fastidiosa]